MLYELFLNYIDTFTFLNVFKYITFRTGLAFFTSLFIALIIGGPFIKLFSNTSLTPELFTMADDSNPPVQLSAALILKDNSFNLSINTYFFC